jgi:hypothetical protein
VLKPFTPGSPVSNAVGAIPTIPQSVYLPQYSHDLPPLFVPERVQPLLYSPPLPFPPAQAFDEPQGRRFCFIFARNALAGSSSPRFRLLNKLHTWLSLGNQYPEPDAGVSA